MEGGWWGTDQELGWVNKTPLLEYDISLARLFKNSSNTILEYSVDALTSPLHWIEKERERATFNSSIVNFNSIQEEKINT